MSAEPPSSISIIEVTGQNALFKAIRFIDAVYKEAYDAPPLLPFDALFAAYAARNGNGGQKIVGTMGIGFGSDGTKLFLEELYGLDPTTAPWPYRGGEIIQFCRWTAVLREPNISLALIYAAAAHAIDRGRTYGLCEMKPHVVGHVRQSGIILKEIPSGLVPEKIPQGHSYYREAPAPRLFMVELEHVCLALREHARR